MRKHKEKSATLQPPNGSRATHFFLFWFDSAKPPAIGWMKDLQSFVHAQNGVKDSTDTAISLNLNRRLHIWPTFLHITILGSENKVTCINLLLQVSDIPSLFAKILQLFFISMSDNTCICTGTKILYSVDINVRKPKTNLQYYSCLYFTRWVSPGYILVSPGYIMYHPGYLVCRSRVSHLHFLCPGISRASREHLPGISYGSPGCLIYISRVSDLYLLCIAWVYPGYHFNWKVQNLNSPGLPVKVAGCCRFMKMVKAAVHETDSSSMLDSRISNTDWGHRNLYDCCDSMIELLQSYNSDLCSSPTEITNMPVGCKTAV
jgi:hypothetical protein